MTIRFHLDENVHGALAAALRRRGIDVTTAMEAGLREAADQRHLAHAREQGRVLVTHDADFLRLHTQGYEHAGIAFSHAGRRSLRELIAALSLLAATTSAEAMSSRVEYL